MLSVIRARVVEIKFIAMESDDASDALVELSLDQLVEHVGRDRNMNVGTPPYKFFLLLTTLVLIISRSLFVERTLPFISFTTKSKRINS